MPSYRKKPDRLEDLAAIRPLAEGTIDGLRQFLLANLGAREAYDLFQHAADAIANEVVESSP